MYIIRSLTITTILFILYQLATDPHGQGGGQDNTKSRTEDEKKINKDRNNSTAMPKKKTISYAARIDQNPVR